MKELPLVVALVGCMAWPMSIQAQDKPVSLKAAESRPSSESATRLALQISYNAALPPAFHRLADASSKPSWIWVTRFSRIAGWQLPDGEAPVRAVRLETQFNGETADIRVSLLRGSQQLDQEELVGVYHLGLGEHKVVSKLRTFGIEPFDITVINLASFVPPPPTVVNNTRTVEVVHIQVGNNPLPGYKVFLRNLSTKNLSALKVAFLQNGGKGSGVLLQGDDGRALIEPGATYEWHVNLLQPEQTPNGYLPGDSSHSIVVQSAVFDDRTFDGTVEPACAFEAFTVGRRVWLQQIVPIFAQQLTENNNLPESVQRFKEKVQDQRYEISEVEKNAPSVVSASCQSPASRGEVAFHGQQLQLLRDLNQLVSTRPVPSVTFASWLKSNHQRYAAWLSRLQISAER